jgi:hypothetical protein
LREECKPVVLEKRLLRRIFGPKGDEVTGKWRRLHNEEPNDLYSDDKMKERGGACSTYGGEERSILNFDGKTQGKETTWKTQA